MKCSAVLQPTNFADWGRFFEKDWSLRQEPADWEIWSDALSVIEMIDSAGFDGFWTTQHHGTPYGMVPNPLLFLSWVAGRTRRLGIGTQVIVVPFWANPLNIAEQIALTDVLLEGREFTVGFARGASPREFEMLGIDQSQARARLVEGVQLIRLALTQEEFSFEGEFFRSPPCSVRPRPRSTNLVDNMVGSFAGPESLEAIARLGLTMLNIVQKPFDEVGADVLRFNQIRKEIGLPDMQPILNVWAFVCDTEAEIAELAPFMDHFQAEVGWHYKLGDPSAFAGKSGYERYLEQARSTTLLNTTYAAHNTAIFVGDADRVIEQFAELQRATSAAQFNVAFLLPGMSRELLARNVERFAERVLPEIKRMEPTMHDHCRA